MLLSPIYFHYVTRTLYKKAYIKLPASVGVDMHGTSLIYDIERNDFRRARNLFIGPFQTSEITRIFQEIHSVLTNR